MKFRKYHLLLSVIACITITARAETNNKEDESFYPQQSVYMQSQTFSFGENRGLEEEYTEEEKASLTELIGQEKTLKTRKEVSLLELVIHKQTDNTQDAYSILKLIRAKDMARALLFQAIVPAGTRFIIPRQILEQYNKSSDSWNNSLDFLSLHYAFPGPSILENTEGENTNYFPLILEDEKKSGLANKVMMMDIKNLKKVDKEEGVFITLHNIDVDDINTLHEYFIGIAIKSSF